MSEIKKPWCTYGDLGLEGIGKVVSESETTVGVIYTEKSTSECWDKKYVKRFGSLEKAIDYFIKNKPTFDIRERQLASEDIRKRALNDFPSK